MTEFGGTGTIRFSKYYTDDASGYTSGISGLTASGAVLKISQFYGKSKIRAANTIQLTSNSVYFASYAPSWTPSAGLTLSFWFKTTQTSNASIFYASQSSGNHGLLIWMASGALVVSLYPPNSSTQSVGYNCGTINDGQWHHFYLKLWPQSESCTCTIKVDGGSKFSANDAQIPLSSIALAYSSTNLGTIILNSSNATYAGFIGSYAQVYLSNIGQYDPNPGASFYSAGKAVDITALISGNPLICLTGGGTNFVVNQGTTGTMTQYGSSSYITTDSTTLLLA